MTTAGRTTESLVAAVRSAGFVRLLVRPDADALATAGVLARGLSATETPYQVSVASTRADRTERAAATANDDEVAVVIGPAEDHGLYLEPVDGSRAVAASELVQDLGAEPDAVLALAGAFAAGCELGDDGTAQLLDRAQTEEAVERRAGVAVPTADPIDGLAHSTLVRAQWSGDPEAVPDALDQVADDDRRLASVVAIDAVGADGASVRAATSIGRLLHPYRTPTGPFETIGGTADVLEAVARTDPGAGVALAIGHGARESALEAWRTHGIAVHAALDAATSARHDGLYVLALDESVPELARTDAVESVAHLAAVTRSPEPVVLAVGDGVTGVATDEQCGSLCERLAAELDGIEDYGPTAGRIEHESELSAETVTDAARAVR